MNREKLAEKVIRTIGPLHPETLLAGNVTAKEIMTLAAIITNTCPICGATAWVNIDCDLCNVCALLKYPEEKTNE